MSSPARLRTTIMVNGVELTDRYVHMVRPTLADLAGAPHADGDDAQPAGRTQRFPAGYRIRSYRLGDAPRWLELVRAAEPFFVIHDDLFEKQFGTERNALWDRMFFVETTTDNGCVPVGTVTAWWQSNWRERGDWGQIHWVAVHPAHQGRGLAKPMMTQALQRLAQSHDRAMLGTSTGRIWAIKVYLDYGFVPDPQELGDVAHRDAWCAVQCILSHPALAQALDSTPR